MLLSVIEFFFVKATIMHQFVIDANNSWIDHFMFIVFVYILSVDFPFPSQKHRMSFINNVEFSYFMSAILSSYLLVAIQIENK